MESWLLGLIIGIPVAVVLLGLCYAVAKRQQRNANRSINEASQLRLLPENAPSGEGVPYTTYHNHFMGGWLQLLDGYPKMNAVNVYNLTLDHVDTVFKGKLQPWCRSYKAACQIFGSGNGPKLVRQGIHAEHNMLYREKGVARTSKGKLFSGRELIALIKDGKSRKEMVFFTYVILPNGEWRFSHTGKHPLRDGLSKHAVHANAARDVIYAGEFHVKDGVFILDNNSGTFSPAKEDLPLVKEIIEKNFPDLAVEAWDFRDQRLIDDLEAAPTRSEKKKKKDEDHTVVDMPLESERTEPQATPEEAQPEEVQRSQTEKIERSCPIIQGTSVGGAGGAPAPVYEAPPPPPPVADHEPIRTPDSPEASEAPKASFASLPKASKADSSSSSSNDTPNPLMGNTPSSPHYPCFTQTQKVNLNDL